MYLVVMNGEGDHISPSCMSTRTWEKRHVRGNGGAVEVVITTCRRLLTLFVTYTGMALPDFPVRGTLRVDLETVAI